MQVGKAKATSTLTPSGTIAPALLPQPTLNPAAAAILPTPQKIAIDSIAKADAAKLSSVTNNRLEIMQKLQEARSNQESSVVCLKNMVDAEDVDDDLQEEVKEECSSFGVVKRVAVHQDPQKKVFFYVIIYYHYYCDDSFLLILLLPLLRMIFFSGVCVRFVRHSRKCSKG